MGSEGVWSLLTPGPGGPHGWTVSLFGTGHYMEPLWY